MQPINASERQKKNEAETNHGILMYLTKAASNLCHN